MEYEKKHPAYAYGLQRRRLALDLYEGGSLVEKNTGYLIRHPYESEKQFNIRRQRATYRNYAAPIVDVFASFINEDRPPRQLPETLREVEQNADRLGTKANPFFSDVTRLAAAGGVRFVLVDMEPPAGRTQADAKQAQRRDTPYFLSINPDDVWDWKVGADGLEWVVLYSLNMEGDQPFTGGVEYEILTVWTRSEWRRYKRALSGSVGSWQEAGKGQNSTGIVPLVPFVFEESGDYMTGLPATDDVLSLVLRIYRRDSELDKMLFDRAVPLLTVCGIDAEQWEAFTVGSSNALMSSERDGINAFYVESSGASFEAQAAALSRDENSVREIALRMIRPLSGVGESAESKQLDRQQLDTQLANFARRCASAETQCWKIAARWLDLDDAEMEEISAPYNENYDVEAATETIISALLSLNGQGVISAATVRETDAVKQYMPDGWTPEEEATRLQQEAGQSGGASGALRLTDMLQRGANSGSAGI
jgi:hypothetical protein|nr:MAG TPA: portal [Caudoviricetes sp.]